MIYLWYGEDSFRIQEELSILVNGLGIIDLHDSNVTSLDGSKINLEELISISSTIPFLADKRVVIVNGLISRFNNRTSSGKRVHKNSNTSAKTGVDVWSNLPDYLSNVPESTELVFIDKNLTQGNNLLSLIRGQVTVKTFHLLTLNEVSDWIDKRVSSMNAQIDYAAISLIAQSMGSNLAAIDSELKKLALYCLGRVITKHDVEELVSYVKETNIYVAVDAILEGKTRIAIQMIHNALSDGESTSRILSLIARQIRLLSLVKDLNSKGVSFSEQMNKLHLPSYPLQKMHDREKFYNLSRLSHISQKLLEADLLIKTTGANEELVLDCLITEMSLS